MALSDSDAAAAALASRVRAIIMILQVRHVAAATAAAAPCCNLAVLYRATVPAAASDSEAAAGLDGASLSFPPNSQYNGQEEEVRGDRRDSKATFAIEFQTLLPQINCA